MPLQRFDPLCLFSGASPLGEASHDMPGYFGLGDSISSTLLLSPCPLGRGVPVNKLGGPPGGGIAADISGDMAGGIADNDGLAHDGGMPGDMAGGMPGDMAGGMSGGMATGGMPGGMATGGMPGGIAAGTSDDTPGIAGGGIIAAVQGAKHC